MREAVVTTVVRTASGKGKPGGALSGVNPTELLASVLAETVARAGIDPEVIDDVLIGCVGQVAEQATNIGRRALLAAGLPETLPAATIDRQCGSSQQAIHFAAAGVAAGHCDIVVVGGVESMSRVPIGSARQGVTPDGPSLARRYPEGLVSQGISAELIAARWGIDREAMDRFSAESHRRAAEAHESGFFAADVLGVEIERPDGTTAVHAQDETVRAGTTAEALAALKPSFVDPAALERFPQIDWSITAGNSSPLSDGASAAVIMSADAAKRLGVRPLARFVSFSVVGDDPVHMLTGPIPGSRLALERAGLSIDDIDAYEVNEAFASVPMAWMKELGADPARLNPRGGAIALGHALGSSGTRLLSTLVRHLHVTGGRYGLQTMCEGGGMANTLIVERL